MQQPKVKIDFNILRPAFEKYIRRKAIEAGTTIVYLLDGDLVEENPVTGERKFIKPINS